MPYVLPERRPDLDKIVDFFVEYKHLSWGNLVGYLIDYSNYGKSNLNIWAPMGIFADFLALASDINLKPNGDVNYILFKYCKYNVEPSYNNYKKFITIVNWASNQALDISWKEEFREAAEWVRIKLLIPYEEEKRKINGDV